MDTLQFLQEHKDLFSDTNNIFIYFLRIIGWAILTTLNSLISGLEQMVNTLFQNISFFESKEITDFITELNPIVKALLGIGIAGLFILLMFNRIEKKSHIAVNVLVFVLVLTGLPMFMREMSNIVETSTSYFLGGGNTISSTILNEGVTDLFYLDQNDFSEKSIKNKHNMEMENVPGLNIAEIAYPDQAEHPEYFENKVKNGKNGQPELEPIDEWSFVGFSPEFFQGYYYRYNIEWLTLFVAFPAIIIALVFFIFKSTKVMFESAYTAVYTLFVAPLDLTSGQRIKGCIRELLSLFLVLISQCLAFKIYMFGVMWAMDTFEGLLLAFVLLGGSAMLIDGPNIVQKLLGIDAGLSSAFHTFYSMYTAGSAAYKMMKDTIHGAQKTLKTAKKVAGGAAVAGAYQAGRTKGVYDYLKEQKQKNDPQSGGEWGPEVILRPPLKEEQKQPLLPGKTDSSSESTQQPDGAKPNPSSESQGYDNRQEMQEQERPKAKSTASQESFNNPVDHHNSIAQQSEKKLGEAENKGRSKDIPDRTTVLSDLVGNKVKDKTSRLRRAYQIGQNTGSLKMQHKQEFFDRHAGKKQPNPTIEDRIPHYNSPDIPMGQVATNTSGSPEVESRNRFSLNRNTDSTKLKENPSKPSLPGRKDENHKKGR